MRYREIAEIVLRNLAGGDISQDFPIKFDEVYARISQILPFLIRKDFYETYQIEGGELSLTNFTTFTAPLYKADTDGESYIVLPSAPLIIHGRGVPELSYTQDRTTQFTYVDIAQYKNYSISGVLNEIQDIIYFYELDDCSKEHRLVLLNTKDCMEKVRVRMIQLTEFDEDTIVPAHLVEPLVQSLRAWFNPQEKDNNDSVNDGINNKV